MKVIKVGFLHKAKVLINDLFNPKFFIAICEHALMKRRCVRNIYRESLNRECLPRKISIEAKITVTNEKCLVLTPMKIATSHHYNTINALSLKGISIFRPYLFSLSYDTATRDTHTIMIALACQGFIISSEEIGVRITKAFLIRTRKYHHESFACSSKR